MQTNRYAYTAPEAVYPAYVSLNERDGFMVLSVRGPRKPNGDCGDTVEVPMPAVELDRLRDALGGGHAVGSPVSVEDQRKYGIIR